MWKITTIVIGISLSIDMSLMKMEMKMSKKTTDHVYTCN